ncbi:MAG: hypothetical protein U0Q15_14930 [Kineosporiaceae bacterium]
MIASSVLGFAALMADTSVAEPDKDKVTPGTLGFIVVFALAVATVLLVRSMVGHLRKIRYSPEPGSAEQGSAGAQPVLPQD